MTRNTFRRILALLLVINFLLYLWACIAGLFDLAAILRGVLIVYFGFMALYAVTKADKD